MFMIFLIILTAAVVTGGILYGVNFWLAKKNGEIIAKRYIMSLAVLFVIYLGLFTTIFFIYNSKMDKATAKIAQMKIAEKLRREAQKAEIARIKSYYAKEMAFAEWKNKVFNTSKEMRESLTKAQADYKLSEQEVHSWKEIAENNTLEKLMPKRNSRDVLNEYQGRLKNSLKDIRNGHTLMTSDIRMLSDNINAIRFVGKEYEKVLGSFRDLYNNLNSSNPGDMPMPKQQKFLFFPVKQKEYNQLVQQYYESKGNAKATAEIAVQLKDAIDKAEQEFKQINKKFDDNLAFLQSNSDSVTYNSEKLQKLIESAISEVNIINDSDKGTTIKINNNKKN
jgi:plasmid maintenance system antidote protein VapI